MASQPPPPARYELLGRNPGVALHPKTKAPAPVLDTSALEIGTTHIEAGDISSSSSRYRTLPLFAGVVVPFSILLAIPSVTGRWYVRAEDDGVVVESTPNPWWLQVAVIASLVCGVLANVCLVVRFAERRVKLTTLLAIGFLTLHDVLNVVILTIFGIQGRIDDGFTFGQPFWMTVCSTIISSTTNVALVVDYVQTPAFTDKGSGLTHKQRTLVVISIVLLTYIAFGALVQSVMLELSFIDALYFTVATIETVGFGDILPASTGSRVFTMLYITFGILHIAAAVSYAREALLEGIVLSLQHRIARLHARESERRVRARWRGAVQARLRAQGSQVWVADRPEELGHGELVTPPAPHVWSLRNLAKRMPHGLGLGREAERDHNCDSEGGLHRRGTRRRRLHLEALTEMQLHAAAAEAGVELGKMLPRGYVPESLLAGNSQVGLGTPSTIGRGASSGYGSSQPPLTWVGGVGGFLASFARRIGYGEQLPTTDCRKTGGPLGTPASPLDDPSSSSNSNSSQNFDLTSDTDEATGEEALRTMVTKEERLAFRVRLGAAVAVFCVFWLVGSVLFSVTEKWPFGMAVYFCFVTFTTVGYGDLAPRTPAGRSIFVAWALLGIAAMTILLAILTEAYSTGYKQVVHYEEEVLLASEAALDDGGLASAKTLVGGGEQDRHMRDVKRIADEALKQGNVDKMRTALEDISRQLSDVGVCM